MTARKTSIWICSSWKLHPWSYCWDCDCKKQYSLWTTILYNRMKNMWYDIKKEKDMTPEIRLEYRRKYIIQ